MVLTLNKDYDYVMREMDFPRVAELTDYLAKSPSESRSLNKISLMMSAFFGIEDEDIKKQKLAQIANDDDDDDDFELIKDLNDFKAGLS